MISVCGHIDPVGISRGFMIPVYRRDLENSLSIFKKKTEDSLGDFVTIAPSDAEEILFLESPIEIECPAPNSNRKFNFRNPPYIMFAIDGALVHGTFEEFSHEIKKILPSIKKYPILYFSIVRELELTDQYESAMGVAFTHMALNYSKLVAEDWANTQIYLPFIRKEIRNVVPNAESRIFDIKLEKVGRTVNVQLSVDNDEEVYLSKISKLTNLLRVFERDVICEFQISKLHEINSDWHENDGLSSEVIETTLGEKINPSTRGIYKESGFKNRGQIISHEFRKIKVIDNYIEINLESFHRSAAAVETRATIFVVPETDNFCLILTTIDPSSLDDVWRLDIYLKDLPGALDSCFEILALHKINILHQETLTAKNGDDENMVIQASFVLDLAKYQNSIDKSHAERSDVRFPNLVPLGLKNTLAQGCADYLVLKSDKSDWRLNIERVGPYFTYKELSGLKKDYIYLDNRLRIPRVDFGKFFGNIDFEADDLSYYAISDSINKYIKVFFVEKNGNSTAFVSVELFEKVGVLSQIAKLFTEHKISIIGSYVRRTGRGSNQVWNALIECKVQTTLLRVLGQISNLPEVCEVLVKETINVDSANVAHNCKRYKKLRLQNL